MDHILSGGDEAENKLGRLGRAGSEHEEVTLGTNLVGGRRELEVTGQGAGVDLAFCFLVLFIRMGEAPGGAESAAVRAVSIRILLCSSGKEPSPSC